MTAQPKPKADPRPFRAFSLDTPEQAAVKRFIDLYGTAPDDCIRRGELLLVGPVPDQGRRAQGST